MLQSMRPVALAALLCLGFWSASSAQEHPQQISCRFRTLGWGDIPGQLYLASGSADMQVPIANQRFSTYHNYHGTPTLAFYRQPPVPRADGTLPPPVAMVTLQPNSQDYILLVLADDSNAGFRILPMADSSTQLPEGSLTLVNLTPAMLGTRLDTESRELPPLQPTLIPLPENEHPDRIRQRVPMQIFWKSPDGWEALRSVFIFVKKGSNNFLFLHKPMWQDGINGYVKDPIQWTIVSR
jgi:hypothetical protein